MSGRPPAAPREDRNGGLGAGLFFVGAIALIILLKVLLGY